MRNIVLTGSLFLCLTAIGCGSAEEEKPNNRSQSQGVQTLDSSTTATTPETSLTNQEESGLIDGGLPAQTDAFGNPISPTIGDIVGSGQNPGVGVDINGNPVDPNNFGIPGVGDAGKGYDDPGLGLYPGQNNGSPCHPGTIGKGGIINSIKGFFNPCSCNC